MGTKKKMLDSGRKENTAWGMFNKIEAIYWSPVCFPQPTELAGAHPALVHRGIVIHELVMSSLTSKLVDSLLFFLNSILRKHCFTQLSSKYVLRIPFCHIAAKSAKLFHIFCYKVIHSTNSLWQTLHNILCSQIDKYVQPSLCYKAIQFRGRATVKIMVNIIKMFCICVWNSQSFFK